MFTAEQIASFTHIEFLLYDYILKHTEKVIYMRVRDVAIENHVSTSTVLRFCRKVGCEGFPEFKVKLKMFLQEKSQRLLSNPQDSLQEFMERTQKQDYDEKINQIASVIAQAKNVVFLGIGNSGVLAEYGSRYFSSLKKFALYINDPFFPIYSHYFDDSVTIALSVSGDTHFALSQITRFKEEGSVIVSITNQAHCTLANISDYHLPYYVTPEYMGEANITTQIPVIYLLERLAKATYNIMQKEEKV
ncbi:hypothetical protein C2W64_04698 [Brevibacillus laterosporus]|nr:MurR/RpiR family transcriptional regulator [Brevibacillus laterosporus]RAP28642.1 hypothetical protein C2W64_04698 [Brevibacillus laterosporus]